MTASSHSVPRRPIVGPPPAASSYNMTLCPSPGGRPPPMSAADARLSRQPVVDLVVALVAVPLLVVFGLMLEANLRGDWSADSERRWNVLGLGLALLLVSLLVCCYATHRLGLCLWSKHNDAHQARLAQAAQQRQGGLSSVSSQLHLVGELPPSYDSVVGFDLPPPPYFTLQLSSDQKQPPTPSTPAPPMPHRSVPPPPSPRGGVPG